MQVVEAMRTTVTNITGMLPPKYFSVKISSSNEDLAQLMYTAMMTGYMFRNAQYRLELHTSITGSLLEGEALRACIGLLCYLPRLAYALFNLVFPVSSFSVQA